MAKRLTEEQQQMWDKLNYVQPPHISFDVNSMYGSMADHIVGIQPMEAPTGETFTFRVLKNR